MGLRHGTRTGTAKKSTYFGISVFQNSKIINRIASCRLKDVFGQKSKIIAFFWIFGPADLRARCHPYCNSGNLFIFVYIYIYTHIYIYIYIYILIYLFLFVYTDIGACFFNELDFIWIVTIDWNQSRKCYSPPLRGADTSVSNPHGNPKSWHRNGEDDLDHGRIEAFIGDSWNP